VSTDTAGACVGSAQSGRWMRWEEVARERLGPASPARARGATTVQVVRTIAEDMSERFPAGEFRAFESYERMLRSADELIYLESQFLWAPEVARSSPRSCATRPLPSSGLVLAARATASRTTADAPTARAARRVATLWAPPGTAYGAARRRLIPAPTIWPCARSPHSRMGALRRRPRPCHPRPGQGPGHCRVGCWGSGASPGRTTWSAAGTRS
jgi:hypothetical protein